MLFKSLEDIYKLSVDLNSDYTKETINYCTALKVLNSYEQALEYLKKEIKVNENNHKK